MRPYSSACHARRAVRLFGARPTNCAAQRTADGRSRAKFIFGGCGGRALREPPKITPLCGAVVLEAAARTVLWTAIYCVMPPSRRRGLASQTGGCRKRFHSFFFFGKEKCGMTRMGFVFWSAVRRRRQECDSSPPQGGGGELRGSKNRIRRNGKVFGSLPAGNATMRMPLRSSAGGRLRPARLFRVAFNTCASVCAARAAAFRKYPQNAEKHALDGGDINKTLSF